MYDNLCMPQHTTTAKTPRVTQNLNVSKFLISLTKVRDVTLHASSFHRAFFLRKMAYTSSF